MKILLTGSEGFVGRHVQKLLRQHTLITVDKLEERVHGNDPDRRPDFACDFVDTPYYVLREVDVIIHLAAQVGVADSMSDPMRYVRQNTLDTTRFYEKLKIASENLERIVVASSMSVYGEPLRNPVREFDPADPASVYGLTKYDQEKLTRLMFPRRGVALRYFNIYGPGQSLSNPYTGVIANFANWLLNDEPPTVFEDGQQTRDFIHVDDVARATVDAALGADADVYNVCTGVATTIEDVALLLAEKLDKDIEPDITFKKREGDIRHCHGAYDKLHNELGWHPEISLDEGFERYAENLR